MADENNYVKLRAQWRETLEKLSDFELYSLAVDMGFKVGYSEIYSRLTEPKSRLIMKLILDDPYHFENLIKAWKRHNLIKAWNKSIEKACGWKENLVPMPGIEKLEEYKKGEC